MIECKECGRQCETIYYLISHLVKKPRNHISLKEYYDKYCLQDESEKKCHYRNCSNDVKFSGFINGYSKYCSASCCNKEKVFSDEYILKQKKVQTISQNRPEVKQRSKDTATAQWKNPDVRQRTLITYKETLNKPGIREAMSVAAKNRWKDPEAKINYKNAMDKLWNNLNYRNKFKESHNTKKAKLNHTNALKKLWVENKEYRDAIVSFHRSSERRQHMSGLVTAKIMNGTWNPHHGNYCWGYYYSEKNNSIMFHRSSTELKAFQLLDLDPLVKSYDYEVLRIPYIDKDGNAKFCIPDMLVQYIDNSFELVEVKPDVFVNDDNIQCKLKAMKEYCIKNNMKFKLWLESEIKNVSEQTSDTVSDKTQ